MAHYEPGEEFDVQYGKSSKTFRVVALNGRQKIEIVRKLAVTQDKDATYEGKMQAIEECLSILAADKTEDVWEGKDESMATQIIRDALAANYLDNDAKKNFE